jgi:hypothetical protein
MSSDVQSPFLCCFSIVIFIALFLAIRVFSPILRKQKIKSHIAEWGEGNCQLITNKKVIVGMTEEMMRLAWRGGPRVIDDREITANSEKERWVYGQPRKEVIHLVYRRESYQD